MTPDERELRELHATWIAAVNACDLDGLLEAMTDDVVFVAPGQAPYSREEFSANFSAAHELNEIECTSELEEVVVAGDVAYTRCRDALSVTPRAGGEAKRFAGHRLTVHRRQPDGRWLLARDAHTVSPIEEKE